MILTAHSIRVKMENRERMIIDLRGTQFTVFRATINSLGEGTTKLGSLNTQHPSYVPHEGVYFFDRNPQMFHNILDYYSTGEIHIPPAMCAKAVLKEIQFWEIPEDALAPCCWERFSRQMEHQRKLDRMHANMFSGHHIPDMCLRMKIWLFFSDPSSSVLARVK